MCLIMFVFLWLVMLTAWWRCADACQEQHQESPRGTKHWLRISASSSWREAYSPCKVYCCDYQNYCWDYSPLELNIITWNIMDIIGIAIEFSIYIFFFAHVFLTWRELLGIDCPPENRFRNETSSHFRSALAMTFPSKSKTLPWSTSKAREGIPNFWDLSAGRGPHIYISMSWYSFAIITLW